MLADLSQRVDSVKEENLKLRSENQVLGQYIENLMSASSVFQSTSPKTKKKWDNNILLFLAPPFLYILFSAEKALVGESWFFPLDSSYPSTASVIWVIDKKVITFCSVATALGSLHCIFHCTHSLFTYLTFVIRSLQWRTALFMVLIVCI